MIVGVERPELNFDIEKVLLPHGLSGLFVVLDGFDGGGKTALVERVCARLERSGREVVRTRSPRREALEDSLYRAYPYEPGRHAVMDCRGLVAMIAGDRLQHAHEVVLPALERGAAVVSDSYVYSAVADNYSRGLRSETWFRELCRFLPRPDFGFILEADEETVRNPAGRHFQACLYAYRQVARASGLPLIRTEGLVEQQENRIANELGLGGAPACAGARRLP